MSRKLFIVIASAIALGALIAAAPRGWVDFYNIRVLGDLVVKDDATIGDSRTADTLSVGGYALFTEDVTLGNGAGDTTALAGTTIISGTLTGSDSWRKAAVKSSGNEATACTIACTGASSTTAIVAAWAGATPGTKPLSAYGGTNIVVVKCADADSSLLRSAGVNVIWAF